MLEIVINPITLECAAKKIKVGLAVLYTMLDLAVAQNGRPTCIIPRLDVPVGFDAFDDFFKDFLDRLLFLLRQVDKAASGPASRTIAKVRCALDRLEMVATFGLRTC